MARDAPAHRLRPYLAAAVILALAGAGLLLRTLSRTPPPPVQKTIAAMGTFVTIEAAAGKADALEDAVEAAADEIRRLEAILSRFDAESDVSKINRAPAGVKVPVNPVTVEVLSRAAEISSLTGGAFDITVAPLVRLWKDAAEAGAPPTGEKIDAALEKVSWRALSLDRARSTVAKAVEGMEIDLGAIAKGFIADAAAGKLRECGVTSGFVNAGGDGVFIGPRPDGDPWRIGVADPREPSEIIETLLVGERAVVTSGNYARYYQIGPRRYSHIIDPRTGRAAGGPASVTVVAADGATADAWATALSVLGEEGAAAARAAGVEFVMHFVDDSGLRRSESEGFGAFREGRAASASTAR